MMTIFKSLSRILRTSQRSLESSKSCKVSNILQNNKNLTISKSFYILKYLKNLWNLRKGLKNHWKIWENFWIPNLIRWFGEVSTSVSPETILICESPKFDLTADQKVNFMSLTNLLAYRNQSSKFVKFAVLRANWSQALFEITRNFY